MFGAHLIPDQCNLATKELPNRLSNTYLLLMFSEIICKYREVLSEYRKLPKLRAGLHEPGWFEFAGVSACLLNATKINFAIT